VLTINCNGKTHDLQLCQFVPINFQETGAHCSNLGTTVSGPFDHRPYSFPIQWLLIWCPHSVYSPSSKELRAFAERRIIRLIALPQAHLPLPCASLLRLSASRLLSGPKVDSGYQIHSLRQAWSWNWTSCWAGIRTIHLLPADPAGAEPTLSLLARFMSRILGAKCVGYVFIYGPGAYHW
jgi:hypothetical protein